VCRKTKQKFSSQNGQNKRQQIDGPIGVVLRNLKITQKSNPITTCNNVVGSSGATFPLNFLKFVFR
jgi:hypothetical protein